MVVNVGSSIGDVARILDYLSNGNLEEEED
jgi:hypothetical protein